MQCKDEPSLQQVHLRRVDYSFLFSQKDPQPSATARPPSLGYIHSEGTFFPDLMTPIGPPGRKGKE